ncbi:MAG: hypothetical protein M3134_02890 [Actinomycetota bacterium]|nr:hypothetical protein [Actinomycetota bacterium]
MSPLVRKHSVTAGAIDKLDATEVRTDVIVTAVRTAAGALKLIAWQLVGDELVRRGEASGGPVGTVSVSVVGGRVATACRDSFGKMTLGLWDVSTDGQIQKADTAAAGTIERSTPIGLGSTSMATAVTEASGHLKVIGWSVSAGGELTRRGDASGGAAELVAADRWLDRRFVTALRNASGNLELIHWIFREDGTVDRLGEITAGAVGGLDVIRDHELTGSDHQVFMTAVRDSSGKLKLIAWRVTAEGPIERLTDFKPGMHCSKPSLVHIGVGRHAVAYVNDVNELRIQCFRWGVQADPGDPTVPTGHGFDLREGGVGGTASLVSAAEIGQTSCVTAVRDGNGNLKVILWTLEDSG